MLEYFVVLHPQISRLQAIRFIRNALASNNVYWLITKVREIKNRRKIPSLEEPPCLKTIIKNYNV